MRYDEPSLTVGLVPRRFATHFSPTCRKTRVVEMKEQAVLSLLSFIKADVLLQTDEETQLSIVGSHRHRGSIAALSPIARSDQCAASVSFRLVLQSAAGGSASHQTDQWR